MQHDQILNFFAKYIEKELGIIYADHNYFQLQNRLEEVAKVLDISNLSALWEHAQKGIEGQFRSLLLDVATNNETSFFRDAKIFRAMEELVLPEFVKIRKPDESFQVWSAASSTGQEAVSLSIMITEWRKKKGVSFPFSIIGTDISSRVLERAQSAQYSQMEVQRGMPSSLLINYFQKNNQDRWTATNEITKPIQFKKMNLKESFPFSQKFHLILCRNVLIYQSVESKIEILKRVTALLNPGGYLVMGAGESLMGLSSEYEQAESCGAVFYRKRLGQAKAS